MKNIRIMSKYEAVINDSRQCSDDYIVISINSPGILPVSFKNNHMANVLYLTFEDVEPEHLTNIITTNSKLLMSLDQARQIKDFVDRYCNVQNIIVHCSLGVSRSAAIGCVLTRYLNKMDDIDLFACGLYHPNRWVYMKMCKVCQLHFDAADFTHKLHISDCNIGCTEREYSLLDVVEL